jgi:hypothetical protein
VQGRLSLGSDIFDPRAWPSDVPIGRALLIPPKGKGKIVEQAATIVPFGHSLWLFGRIEQRSGDLAIGRLWAFVPCAGEPSTTSG